MVSRTGPILIVEDIPHILELLEITLKFKGYEVVTARNGNEALDQVVVHQPVLILTDILMPKLDGFALAQQIRRNPKTRHIPIIFISATFITLPRETNRIIGAPAHGCRSAHRGSAPRI
jgi:CheY-like chemotaxis protein